MPTCWSLYACGPVDPAENMACDEALLDCAEAHAQPVVRFYGWTQPAATFGYFQDYTVVAELSPLRPLLRRPTGGGLVPHDRDWTYSICIPPSDPWYQMKAVDSYRRTHEWLQSAFARLGIVTVLAPCCDHSGPGQCFVGAEQYDLILGHAGGAKIAGAAQRRRKDGLLIQGSVQAGGLNATRAEFEQACLAAAAAQWGAQWQDFAVTEEFRRRCAELVRSKYARDEYHRDRFRRWAEPAAGQRPSPGSAGRDWSCGPGSAGP